MGVRSTGHPQFRATQPFSKLGEEERKIGCWSLSTLPALPVARLLLDLQSIHDRRQFAQDLVRLLVELELGGDEIGEVAQGLWRVEDLLRIDISMPGSIYWITDHEKERKNAHSSSPQPPPP